MSEGCGEYIVTRKTGRVCPGEGTYSRFTITTPGGWARLESGGQALPTVTATGASVAHTRVRHLAVHIT